MRTVIPEYIIYLFKDIYVCDIVGEVVWVARIHKDIYGCDIVGEVVW